MKTLSPPLWPAGLIWLVCALLLFWLDGWFSPGNLALLLVLGSTLASYFMGTTLAMASCVLSMLAFNWFFVTPRYTLQVLSAQDMVLLVTLLATSMLISVLTSRLRQSAQAKAGQALWAQRLQHLSSEVQHAARIEEQLAIVRHCLSEWWGLSVHIWLDPDRPDVRHAMYRAWLASQQEPGPIGPGTGRHESTWDWALPLRAGVIRVGTLCMERDRAPLEQGRQVIEASGPLIKMLADEIHRLQTRLQTQATEQALAHQQLRNTLLSAISHDYRTPLATIAGLASAILVGTTDQVRRQDLQAILSEIEHLNRITSHTLQLARLDAPQAAWTFTWESVEEMCGAALTGASRRHPGRSLKTDIPLGLPLLHVDPVLVVQLLDNLLDNALRFSPQDSTVILQAQWRDGRIWIKVRDQGMGIPEGWRQRVFDPFVRVPALIPEVPSTTSGRSGMGLGLSLCKAIARLHHADMGIESVIEGGTEVWVCFPVAVQPDLDWAERADEKVA